MFSNSKHNNGKGFTSWVHSTLPLKRWVSSRYHRFSAKVPVLRTNVKKSVHRFGYFCRAKKMWRQSSLLIKCNKWQLQQASLVIIIVPSAEIHTCWAVAPRLQSFPPATVEIDRNLGASIQRIQLVHAYECCKWQPFQASFTVILLSAATCICQAVLPRSQYIPPARAEKLSTDPSIIMKISN